MVRAALQLEFCREKAERQLDRIIHRGRYAELLVYDDEALYLEPVEAPAP